MADAGMDVSQVFYCGESVLLPAWRGQGVGHAIFDARQTHARVLGDFTHSAFAAIDRDCDDPRSPADHRDNNVFWQKRGYLRSNIRMQLLWNEHGQGDTMHNLSFWLRDLENKQ